jgi:hypothetical protein
MGESNTMFGMNEKEFQEMENTRRCTATSSPNEQIFSSLKMVVGS